MSASTTIAIIGAGAAGLAAARVLQSRGCHVHVFDKARKPGGRLAMRRSDWGSLHHGAPVLTVPTTGLPKPVADFLADSDIVATPAAALGSAACQGLSYSPNLNALAAKWATGLTVHCEHTLVALERSDRGWMLHFEHTPEVIGPFAQVLLTAPTEQALALLAPLPDQDGLRTALSQTAHAPCWTVLWVPEQAPAAGEFCQAVIDDVLALIVREDLRPGDSGQPRYALHARADWSHDHLDDDAKRVAQTMIAAAAQQLGMTATTLHQHPHRWRYATVTQAAGQPFLAGNQQLWYAGDACLGATVIAAIASGLAAAEAMAAR